MPLYDFLCECGQIQEQFFHIVDCPEIVPCECGKDAKKILSAQGAVIRDTRIIWMESASKVLVKEHERPVTTRTEYRKYLKENKLAPIG